MAKNQDREDRPKPKVSKCRVENYCYYEGLMYSPGAYVKVDGIEKKLLYCNFDGVWEVRKSPED